MNGFRASAALATLLVGASWAELRAEGAAACGPGPARAAAEAMVVDGPVSRLRGDAIIALERGALLCPGDRVVTGEGGRVELRIAGRDTTLGLTGNSSLRLGAPEAATPDAVLESGLVRFISSVRGLFEIETGQATAGIEGTEALVATTGAGGQTLVLVREGDVRVSAARAAMTLGPDEAALASGGAPAPAAIEALAPSLRPLLADPEGAADWAIHYPPVLLGGPDPAPQVSDALRALAADDPDGARAALEPLIDRAQPDPQALALASVIAAARGRTAEALAAAGAAVALAPDLGAGHVALSYARQAAGDVADARAAAEVATQAAPEDAFAWARLAELRLLEGDRQGAKRPIARSLALRETAYGRAIEGFERLSARDRLGAGIAFNRAVALEDSAPLPRLGLGLLKIREGEVSRGRRDLELAAALGPRQAAIRTWLGRAYFEEELAEKALSQFALAERMDPDDPTPWLFSASTKAAANRPLEALRDLREAEARGPGRSVLRSERGLGDDRAVRASMLGRVYDDLGFSERARDEAGRAMEEEPTNAAVQRLAAELYGGEPDLVHARASATLKSQILGAPGLAPINPALAEADLAVLDPIAPARTTFAEYSPFFEQDGWRVQLSGFGGTQSTFGDLASATALVEGMSLGIGQYLYETDGYHPNNRVRHDVISVQGKAQLSPGLSVFAEYRHRNSESGDRVLNFDLETFNDTVLTEDERNLARIGFHGEIGARHDLLGVVTVARAQRSTGFTAGGIDTELDSEDKGFSAELQHIARFGPLTTTLGAFHAETDGDNRSAVTIPFFFPPSTTVLPSTETTRQSALYGYGQLRLGALGPVRRVDLTARLSLDRFETRGDTEIRPNPKLGLRAHVAPGVRLRAAYTQSVAPTPLFDQRLEPVTVAGLAQDRPEVPGSRVRQLAAGADYEPLPWLGFGAEGRFAWVLSPGTSADAPEQDSTVRAWSVHARMLAGNRVSGTLRLAGAHIDSELPADVRRSDTIELGTDLRYFHPSGLFGMAGIAHVWHDSTTALGGGDDAFIYASLGVGYRLPKQRGVLSIEMSNLLDQDFGFQERPSRFLGANAPVDPLFAREFTLFARASVDF